MTIDIFLSATSTSTTPSTSTSMTTTTPGKPNCPNELYICSQTSNQAVIANVFKSEIYGQPFSLQNGKNVVYQTDNKRFGIWWCQNGGYWNLDYMNIQNPCRGLVKLSKTASGCPISTHWK